MSISNEQRLARMVEKYGEGSRIVQMFRDQMSSKQSGQDARDMYITGMMKRQPEQMRKGQ
jgi:hypothetical protein